MHKTKKLAATISKRWLPTLNQTSTQKETSTLPPKSCLSSKAIASDGRHVEFNTLRGMSTEDDLSHDIVESSPLFFWDISTKPEKSLMMEELEQCF